MSWSTSHVTRHMSHVTCHTSHVTCHMSHATRHSIIAHALECVHGLLKRGVAGADAGDHERAAVAPERVLQDARQIAVAVPERLLLFDAGKWL